MIGQTAEGLKNNRSELLDALAASGELGRARFDAEKGNETAKQQALMARAAKQAATVGVNDAAQADLDAMVAARRGYIGDIRDNQAAAYDRAMASINDRNAAYIDQIGAAAILQQQQLDAQIALEKQAIDAAAAARAAASRGGGGGSGFSGLGDPFAQDLSPMPLFQMDLELASARSGMSDRMISLLQDDPEAEFKIAMADQLLDFDYANGGKVPTNDEIGAALINAGFNANQVAVLAPIYNESIYGSGSTSAATGLDQLDGKRIGWGPQIYERYDQRTPRAIARDTAQEPTTTIQSIPTSQLGSVGGWSDEQRAAEAKRRAQEAYNQAR